jgi:hypothetical protein
MNKVISFALWGQDPKYCVGAVRNAQLAMEIYPDWICRFYVSADVPFETQGQLANCDNVDLLEIPSYHNEWRGMLTRFEPIQDNEVEIMIVRDCDSRLSLREKEAVDEWLESDKCFHTMHDHPFHTVPILGGLWGIKKGLFDDLGSHASEWGKSKESRWQVDQDFLTEVVHPIVKNDTMNHDEFFRHLWGGKPFPNSRRGLEFVGQVFDENEITISEHVTALAKVL